MRRGIKVKTEEEEMGKIRGNREEDKVEKGIRTRGGREG